MFEDVDNPLARAADVIASSWTRMFGSRNDRLVREILPQVAQINELEAAYAKLTDEELKAKTVEFRATIKEQLEAKKAPKLLEDARRLRFDGAPEEGDAKEKKYREIEQKILTKILPDAFATVREASMRTIGQRHYDVQLIGGVALHRGWIAEMVTGEGKTLVATLPSYLNGLPQRGVHVITVNDYLAQRDRDTNAEIMEFLGITIGCIQAHMGNFERREAYGCDITYGTNNEFGFDYLRDNMKVDHLSQVQQGRRNFSIVDEVDSILIDEARTPLIISGDASDAPENYGIANEVSKKLRGVDKNKLEEEAKKQGVEKEDLEDQWDFVFSEKDHSVTLTERGVERVEKLLGEGNIYETASAQWPHYIEQSIRAHSLYKRDKAYVVQEDEIIIVDEHTGRLMQGRTWSDGLHQAIEAKEGVKVKQETQTLATITLQNYFRLYNKLSGMTGTALTEASEFWEIYKLDVLSVPTNRPLRRTAFPDVIYRSVKEKYKAICAEIEAVNALGRPILVGTISVQNSERLSEMLARRGIEHEVLNAKHHGREASIVEGAGVLGRVTVATNMAGRGTDITLGTFSHQVLLDHWKKFRAAPKDLELDDPQVQQKLLAHWRATKLSTGTTLYEEWEWRGIIDHFTDVIEFEGKNYKVPKLCGRVQELGGLHIIGTERHDSRRIDNQLRGRCGRQGDPGSSRFYLSLQDDLMRIFASDRVSWLLEKLGMEEDQEISSPMVTRAIERAQKKVEAHHFDARKNVLEYDKVMDEQRKLVYRERQRILEGDDDDLRKATFLWIERSLSRSLDEYAHPDIMAEDRDYPGLCDWVRKTFSFRVLPREIQEQTEEETFQLLLGKIGQAYSLRETEMGMDEMRKLERYIMLQEVDEKWKDHLRGMDQLRGGIGWRGYAQTDPKIAYKKEGYELFQEMWETTAGEITSLLFRVRPVTAQEEQSLGQIWEPTQYTAPSEFHAGFEQHAATAEAEAYAASQSDLPSQPVRREQPKVSRNAPCPCGSGKKFKKCCGGKAGVA
ncbi:MAG: preprotein translocase subunit SecA [Planctomycetes bacterium]|nr:preprotein translocase subunit SecA [Planctomycetota bacterium]